MSGKTKPLISTATKLKRITKLSDENPKMVLHCLMPHLNKESLISCFNELDGRKAVGTDHQTKADYGKNLESNIESLIAKMRTMSYRPGPVREVLIPKGNGKSRPLGISNFEDKLVQLMFSKILEAIYDPIFHDFSYGFRRGRSCHQAVKALQSHLFKRTCDEIIDVDLANFFGTIDHEKLIAVLRMKIKDETFMRYIARMLKSGVLSNGELQRTEEGTPQGSVVSPILANIYAHYALDDWFTKMVEPAAQSEVKMFRYCDDLVICCSSGKDSERIMKSLPKRMDRFSLKLNQEKTKRVSFNKTLARKGMRQGVFDFLGFTFFLAKSRNSQYYIPRLKTSRVRIRSKLKAVKEWCKRHRCRYRLRKLWQIFCSKLRGHIQYYGVSHNLKAVSAFVHTAIGIFYKWINRRSQRKSLDWGKFHQFQREFPAPKSRVCHRLF